ncbi:MAG: hypothetical protein HPY53_01725 [Brevinematales bacterium]|nr:hypothetical protein [Brevinematales bacterium]
MVFFKQHEILLDKIVAWLSSIGNTVTEVATSKGFTYFPYHFIYFKNPLTDEQCEIIDRKMLERSIRNDPKTDEIVPGTYVISYAIDREYNSLQFAVNIYLIGGTE